MGWAAVVAVMAAIGVIAAAIGAPPAEHHEIRPLDQMVDDAVLIRHLLVAGGSSGDTATAAAGAGALGQRWEPRPGDDHPEARTAASKTLLRIETQLRQDSQPVPERLRRAAAEADLFAALAVDPTNQELIRLAGNGWNHKRSDTTTPERPSTHVDLRQQLEQLLVRAGGPRLEELDALLAQRGAPSLPTTTRPTLDIPTREDLPR